MLGLRLRFWLPKLFGCGGRFKRRFGLGRMPLPPGHPLGINLLQLQQQGGQGGMAVAMDPLPEEPLHPQDIVLGQGLQQGPLVGLAAGLG